MEIYGFLNTAQPLLEVLGEIVSSNISVPGLVASMGQKFVTGVNDRIMDTESDIFCINDSHVCLQCVCVP